MQPCVCFLLVNCIIFLIFCSLTNIVFITTSSINFFTEEKLCFIDQVSTQISTSSSSSILSINYTIGVYYSISKSKNSYKEKPKYNIDEPHSFKSSPVAYIDSSFVIPSYMFAFIENEGVVLSDSAKLKLTISTSNIVKGSLHICYIYGYYLNQSGSVIHINNNNNNSSIPSINGSDGVYKLKSAQLNSLINISRVYYQVIFFCIQVSISILLFLYHLTIIFTTLHSVYYNSFCISNGSGGVISPLKGINTKDSILTLLIDDYNNNNSNSSSNYNEEQGEESGLISNNIFDVNVNEINEENNTKCCNTTMITNVIDSDLMSTYINRNRNANTNSTINNCGVSSEIGGGDVDDSNDSSIFNDTAIYNMNRGERGKNNIYAKKIDIKFCCIF